MPHEPGPTPLTPPGVAFSEAYKPLWHCFGFQSDEHEAQYCQGNHQLWRSVGALWCIFHIIIAVLGLSRGNNSHLAHVPSVGVALLTLVLLFVPGLKRHPRTICSLAAVLLAACQGWIVHSHASVAEADLERHRLWLVLDKLSGDTAAMHQLDAYVQESTGTHVLDVQLMVCFSQCLMLFIVGFCPSAVVGYLLLPIGICIVPLFSPIIPVQSVLIRLGVSTLVVLLMLVGTGKVTLRRRSFFLLLRHFEASLHKAVVASQKADKALSLTLKTAMADVCGEIELFLTNNDCCTTDQRDALTHANALLNTGMRRSRYREAYAHVAAGDYAASLLPCNVTAFVAELARGCRIEVQCLTDGLVVNLDETICGLILDHAIDNAFLHGYPKAPGILLTVLGGPQANQPEGKLTFRVTNRANPALPVLTDEYIRSVLAEDPHGPWASAMPDKAGLRQSFLAAEAIGAQLSLRQTGDHVACVLELWVTRGKMPAVVQDRQRRADLAAFPSDLTICCIDDSATARKLVQHHLVERAQTTGVHVYGGHRAAAAEFMETATSRGDIVVLDQHLKYSGGPDLLGTDLVGQLKDRGFQGLICMRSATNSKEDEALCRRSGCHCVFGKEVPMADVVEDMKVAYVRLLCRERDASLPLHNVPGDVEDPELEQPDTHSPAIPRAGASASTLHNPLDVEDPAGHCTSSSRLSTARRPECERQEVPDRQHLRASRSSSVRTGSWDSVVPLGYVNG